MATWRLNFFVVIVAPALLLSVDAFRLGDLDEASEELAEREVSQALAGIMKEMMNDKALQKLADRAVEAEMQGKRIEDKILQRKNEQQLLKEMQEDEARRQEQLGEEERRQETQGFEAFVKAYGQTFSAKKSEKKEQGKHEHNSFRKEGVSLHDADADDEKNNENKDEVWEEKAMLVGGQTEEERKGQKKDEKTEEKDAGSVAKTDDDSLVVSKESEPQKKNEKDDKTD